MNKVVGIDLGTTNSVVAAIEGGQPTVIPNAQGGRTTPSVVAYISGGELLVGQLAKRQAVVNPENTFFSVKRFMGCKYDELSEEALNVPYEVYKDPRAFNNQGTVKIKCAGSLQRFTPEEISAQVIRKLVNDAKEYLGQDVTKAVITVPAYFNDAQRQATVDAGKIAGIEVLRIINEPTAASLAYGLDKKQNETILVFDLGGGTFDVSILEVGDGIFEVLSTAGDTNLGGDDFDKVIVRWLIDEFQKNNEGAERFDLTKDVQALQRLTEAAEKAKIELSNVEKTTINLPFITANRHGAQHIQQELTREKFENLCKDLIDRCRIPVEQAIKFAKIDKSAIDEIVLVGGSTRIPAIQELVYSLTGKKPNKSVNPDEVVAIGAAVQAGILAGEITDVLLLDVTPLSLGVETLGKIMTKLITRNTTIPVKKSETFSTAIDNQESVDIHVVQGERRMASANKSLGVFTLEVPPAPKGEPKIDVTFDINVDGILSVTATESKTGNEQSITIKGSSNLSEKEIDEMIKEAEKFAAIDEEEKEKSELLQEAEIYCERLQKTIDPPHRKPDGQSYTDYHDKKVQFLCEDLRKAIKEKEYDLVKEYLEKVKEVLKNGSEFLYKEG